MAHGSDYEDQDCTMARTLGVVGERWTLLIVRDVFYGVRHFGDLVEHLGLPRAVLSDRLTSLVAEGVLSKIGSGRNTQYQMTSKGSTLWPVVLTLMAWGTDHYAPTGPNRIFMHVTDGGQIEAPSICQRCQQHIRPADIEMRPGPGLAPSQDSDDSVTVALRKPHRLLEPLSVATRLPS